MNLWWTIQLRKKRWGNQHIIPKKGCNSCLNCDFFGFYDYSDTRLDLIKWNLSRSRRSVRCIVEKKEKNNPFTYNHLKFKSKTSIVILKILIQDKMPSTSFNGSGSVELNSPFFNHHLFIYSIYHAPKRSSIHLINLRIRL
jgi:hypothetical protein